MEIPVRSPAMTPDIYPIPNNLKEYKIHFIRRFLSSTNTAITLSSAGKYRTGKTANLTVKIFSIFKNKNTPAIK